MGKGTVVRSLLNRIPDLYYSVSVTTREPRPGEQDGVHYRFVSDERFDELIREGALLEWADVYDHRSGTPAEPVERALGQGRDVAAEVDVQGARSIRDRVPDSVLIFLVPPSRQELVRRLRDRGTEHRAATDRRVAAADHELAQQAWFDHVVVNDDLERATAEVAAIIVSSRTHD